MTKRAVGRGELQELARFRHELRVFLHVSETAARDAGLTPAQHQLLLAVAGWGGDRPPTVGEVADLLLVRHHSAVELVGRAEEAGLVVRRPDPIDARRQQVALTPSGENRLDRLAALHRAELRRFREPAVCDLDAPT